MKERCNDLAVWIDPPDQWNKLVRKLRWMGWEDEARWLQIAVAIGKNRAKSHQVLSSME
jgi:hypothetical protein